MSAIEWKKSADLVGNNGTQYVLWRLTDPRPVFQITSGKVPTNDAGYYNPSSLMYLKGLSRTKGLT